MIERDYKCKSCGFVRGAQGLKACPQCGGEKIIGVILTAPAVHTGTRTKNADRILGALAQDFNLSDMNNRGGRPVKGASGPDIFNPQSPAHRATPETQKKSAIQAAREIRSRYADNGAPEPAQNIVHHLQSGSGNRARPLPIKDPIVDKDKLSIDTDAKAVLRTAEAVKRGKIDPMKLGE